MSHAATNWALKQRGLRPVEKLALIHLADCHNGQTGECFPSQQKLAEECEVSRATMNRVLAAIEEAGLISRHQRVNQDTKRQESTLYILHLDRVNSASQNETREAEPCLKNGESRVSKIDVSVSHSCETLTGKGTGNITGNAREQDQLHLLSNDDPKVDPVEEAFTRFWEAFPKKVGDKKKVLANFRRAVKEGTDPETIIAAAASYAARMTEAKFIKYPQGWLSDCRWTEEAQQADPPNRYQRIIAEQAEKDRKAREYHEEAVREEQVRQERRKRFEAEQARGQA